MNIIRSQSLVISGARSSREHRIAAIASSKDHSSTVDSNEVEKTEAKPKGERKDSPQSKADAAQDKSKSLKGINSSRASPKVQQGAPASGRMRQPLSKARALAMSITNAIQAATSINELINIVQTSGHVFDKINVTAAQVKAAKISFSKGSHRKDAEIMALLELLKPIHLRNADRLGARELSNIVSR
jgi:hypothetical protein